MIILEINLGHKLIMLRVNALLENVSNECPGILVNFPKFELMYTS